MVFWVANPNIATTFFGICFTLVMSHQIKLSNVGVLLTLIGLCSSLQKNYEDVDVKAVQQALLKQHRHTDLIILKLNSVFAFS
ncbi:hypothetical protein DFP81_102144 [Marinomonas pollencensis]|uniref:Uncharacterized protein n=1 Tax=Marinomonas pollencensis TaxID=491954 RepID=A0A3E0DR85_9GAMM|nr:hypothetical protein DFP81_102144 [Marinomonas pollencensis]